MGLRLTENDTDIKKLLDLIEKRFDLRILDSHLDHIREVHSHYREKREFILVEHGEIGVQRQDYAKAVLISEATRLMILREITPRPKKKKKKD